MKNKTENRNILYKHMLQLKMSEFLCFVFDDENNVILLYVLRFVYQIRALIQP